MNPIFVIVASLFIFGISIFSLNSAKINSENAKESFIEFESIANNYHVFNTKYSNKKDIRKAIDNIIKSSRIRNVNILESKNKITVRMTSVKIKKVHKFINKVLNERFNIINLTIEKDFVLLEIGII
jgi:hypothetical protein